MGHAPGPSLIEQHQGDLRFGPQGHLGWDASFAPAFGVLRPALRQIPPHPHWPCRSWSGVAAGDRELTVAHVAQGPRVLAGHPHRRLARLGKAGIIQHQHPIPQGGLGAQLLHPLAIEVLLVPQPVGEELLQPLLTGAWDRLGDGVAVLVGPRGEQPRPLSLQRFRALRASEAHLESARKLLQFRQLRRTRMDVHGILLVVAEDTTSEPLLTKQY
jgi:hypothetical protein